MNFQEYVSLAVRTESAKDPFTPDFVTTSGLTIRMFHAIIGMCTEVEEMIEAKDSVNMLEECGDFCWYQAIYEAAVPGTFTQDVVLEKDNTLELVSELRRNSMGLLDHTKKVLMYGKPFDFETVKYIMQHCFVLVNELIIKCGGTVEQVRSTNINKLAARYPEKFTEFNAENRNLTVERKILENGTI